MGRISFADVERLIGDQIPESLQLEYKRAAALDRTDEKVREIRKDVSALANSDGGRIVYGVIERESLPRGLDEGVDPQRITIDWLTQIIHGGVRPRLEALDIYSLSAAGQNPFVYVIDVPKGRTAHMSEGRYWKRHGAIVQWMEDYEVRDLMRRAEVPDIRARLGGRPESGRLNLDLSFRNRSSASADYFLVLLLFQSGIRAIKRTGGDITYVMPAIAASGRQRRVAWHGFEDIFEEWRWRWWRRMPIFEPDWEAVGSLQVDTPYGQHILWLTRAPGMENRGAYMVTNSNPTGLKAVDVSWTLSDDEDEEGEGRLDRGI